MKQTTIPEIGTTVKLGDIDYIIAHHGMITQKGESHLSTYLIKQVVDCTTVFDSDGSTEYMNSTIHEKCKIYYEKEIPDNVKPLLLSVPYCYGCPVFIPTLAQVASTTKEPDGYYHGSGEWSYFADDEARKFKNKSGTAQKWWLQSQWPVDSTFVCFVDTDGSVSGSIPNITRGFRPAICMKTEDLMKYLGCENEYEDTEVKEEEKKPEVNECDDKYTLKDDYHISHPAKLGNLLDVLGNMLHVGKIIKFGRKYTNGHDIRYVIVKEEKDDNDMDAIIYLMPLYMDQCIRIPCALLLYDNGAVNNQLCLWYSKPYLPEIDHRLYLPTKYKCSNYPYFKDDKSRVFMEADGVPVAYWVSDIHTDNLVTGVDMCGKFIDSNKIKDDTILAFRPIITIMKRELILHMQSGIARSLFNKETDTVTIGQVMYKIDIDWTHRDWLVLKPIPNFGLTYEYNEVDTICDVYDKLLVRPHMNADVTMMYKNPYQDIEDDQDTGEFVPLVKIDIMNAVKCITDVVKLDNGGHNFILHK